MGSYEKEIDERVASDAFKEIQYIENHRFVSLPRQLLLQSNPVNCIPDYRIICFIA